MAEIKLTSTFDPSSDFVLYEGDVLDLLKTKECVRVLDRKRQSLLASW